jgi:hypothetical protein
MSKDSKSAICFRLVSCSSKAGRITPASRQASKHEMIDGVLLHSWFVSMKLTSALWLRPVCGCFHNLIPFNCAPFFASCRRYRVLIVTCLDACRCAAYLSFRSSRWRRHIRQLTVNGPSGIISQDIEFLVFRVCSTMEPYNRRHNFQNIWFGCLSDYENMIQLLVNFFILVMKKVKTRKNPYNGRLGVRYVVGKSN